MTAPLQCSSDEAVGRALRWVGHGVYGLGAGGYNPARPDDPFTVVDGVRKCDCSRFVLFAYKLPGHRPGFNKQPKATVSDDINCDSAIEQAEHAGAKDRLFEVVTRPELGDLLVFPSIRDKAGKRMRIGHTGIVVGLCAEWDPASPQFGELTVVQCQGSRKPAIVKGSGSGWMFRSQYRGLVDPAWRSRILRVRRPTP